MPTLTLAALQARVYATLDGNTNLYGTAEVTAIINEAIHVLNLATAFLQAAIPIYSVQNRIWYETPPALLIPTRISFENIALQPISVDSLGQAHAEWTSASTANTQHPVTYWIRRGTDRFGIWPADAYGGGVLMVTGIREPVPLVNQTDSIGFPNDVLNAFDVYTGHVAQLKESSQTFAQSSTDYTQFQSAVKRTAAWQGLKMPRYWVENLEQE